MVQITFSHLRTAILGENSYGTAKAAITDIKGEKALFGV